MALDILYFAWVRERVGRDHERVDPPADVTDVAGLVAWLAERSQGHRAALGEPAKLRAAVDDAFVGFAASIAGAREISLFPPVTGG